MASITSQSETEEQARERWGMTRAEWWAMGFGNKTEEERRAIVGNGVTVRNADDPNVGSSVPMVATSAPAIQRGLQIREFRNLAFGGQMRPTRQELGNYQQYLIGLSASDENALMEDALLNLVSNRDMQLRNSPINFTDLTTDVSFGDRIASSIQAQRSKRARPQFGIG